MTFIEAESLNKKYEASVEKFEKQRLLHLRYCLDGRNAHDPLANRVTEGRMAPHVDVFGYLVPSPYGQEIPQVGQENRMDALSSKLITPSPI